MGKFGAGSTRYINGELYARVRFKDENGKQKEKLKKASNITHAKTLIRQMLNELDTPKPTSENGRKTFTDLADWYEKNHMIPAQYSGGIKIAGLRSLHTHKYVIKVFREHFGDTELNKITYDEVNSFRLQRFKTTTIHKKPRTITTINRELGVLRNMFQIALRKEWITKNPFFGEKPLIMKSLEPKRERILTAEEEKVLLEKCTGRRKHLRPVIITALDTGMRRGELITLVWSDLDFENRQINIKAFNTKTERARTIVMTERVFQELTALYAASAKKPEERVFGIQKDVKKGWKKVCEEAKIEGLRFHDLRHTFATRLIQGGIPAEFVSKLLGHTNIETTSRYVNVHLQVARLAATALEPQAMQ
jgi:integrase